MIQKIISFAVVFMCLRAGTVLAVSTTSAADLGRGRAPR
jgi:hypothetical protein